MKFQTQTRTPILFIEKKTAKKRNKAGEKQTKKEQKSGYDIHVTFFGYPNVNIIGTKGAGIPVFLFPYD